MEKVSGFVDITDESCPYTIVKAKVALDDIKIGEILEIKMETGVPCRSLPKVMMFDGHEVLEMKDNENGTHTMLVKKMVEF